MLVDGFLRILGDVENGVNKGHRGPLLLILVPLAFECISPLDIAPNLRYMLLWWIKHSFLGHSPS